MKKISYIVIFIISFVCFSLDVSARQVVVINGYEVRFRSSIDTSTTANIITAFNPGATLDLIDANVGATSACSAWYRARYNGIEGYVCGDFATIEEVADENGEVDIPEYTDYTEYLKSLGFPDSYIPYLINLHNAHPDWQFKVFNVAANFDYIVGLEYDQLGHGWSLVEDTGRYFDGYKSTDSWSYSYYTDTFYNNFSGGGRNWYAASRDIIRYYMDPRNFLNERQVFMFETLSYNATYHTREGVEAMLRNTFMQGYANNEQTKTYVDAFIDAAITYNVSPYVLISRVIQEVGAGGSTIVSGTVSGFEGYYNFYNIQATGAQNQIIANGLRYAVSQGWNSPYNAIVGGASFLADSYINAGQDTLYLQKWDLLPPMYGRHQYMQNIQAPSTESVKTYNGYNGVGLLNGSFVFSIPVFNNMPDKTIMPSSGNPNNYLSSLSVNGSYLFETPTEETSFSLVLDGSTQSVDIAATKINGGASINGTGSVSIPNENNRIDVIVTAANGAVRTYTINITRKITQVPDTNDNENDDGNSGLVLDISEILRILNINNDGTYVYGYELGTMVSSIVNSIRNKEFSAIINYVNKEGIDKSNGIVACGDKLSIKTDREEKEYTMTLYGDVNGDGKITSADYIAIKNHIMDVKKLDTVESICADVSRDGNVTSADYIAIKNHIMDIKKITQ